MAMFGTAIGDERIWQRFDEFDRNPYLLNFLNGTLDIRDKALRPHDRLDYVTRLIPHNYVEDATAPVFEALGRRVFLKADGPDSDETYRYALTCAGYSLLGGNQLDAVCEHAYPLASVLGYRWPAPLPSA